MERMKYLRGVQGTSQSFLKRLRSQVYAEGMDESSVRTCWDTCQKNLMTRAPQAQIEGATEFLKELENLLLEEESLTPA